MGEDALPERDGNAREGKRQETNPVAYHEKLQQWQGRPEYHVALAVHDTDRKNKSKGTRSGT